MLLHGKVLAGICSSFTTKKGEPCAKAKLRVLDTGEEAVDELRDYWIDFLGDMALTQEEVDQVKKQDVTIEIRRIGASSGKNGSAYLNLAGGIVSLNGTPVQAKFRSGASRKAS